MSSFSFKGLQVAGVEQIMLPSINHNRRINVQNSVNVYLFSKVVIKEIIAANNVKPNNMYNCTVSIALYNLIQRIDIVSTVN